MGSSRNVLTKMVKDTRNSGDESAVSHSCGGSCLGPLTFHCRVSGDQVRLSQGCRLATRKRLTFRDGLVFSSRPVGLREKIHLKVVGSSPNWHGALRLGFTNVPPAGRSLPLASMAIPDLSKKPGHWAAAVHESCCTPGSELKFWASSGGKMFLRVNNNKDGEILQGLDVSKPLWAMIDLYGQTSCVFLQGSEKHGMFRIRRSCPASRHIGPADTEHNSTVILNRKNHHLTASEGSSWECVVCMEREAGVTLSCGHQCLCHDCADRVIQEFGCCPLCRRSIGSPLIRPGSW